MATLKASVENREALLAYFREFFSQRSNESATTAYLIEDDGGSGFVYQTIDMLLKHGVVIERTTEPITLRESFDYWDGTNASRSYDSGTFLIRTNQARHVLINTLMQRQMAIEDSVMYDMATWSIPLAYNLDAAWTESDVRVATVTLTAAPELPSGVTRAGARYAYVIDWEQREAPRALSMLWEAGYRVRSVTKTFTVDGQEFSRGTLVVLLGRNREKEGDVETDMARIAEEAGVVIDGMNSGRVDEGIDLASGDSQPVLKPRVGLLSDAPMSSYTVGQLWFLFDQWTGFGIDRIRTGSFASLDLAAYDVLLIPAGNLSETVDSTETDRLKNWVNGGGTLIATESNAAFFTKDQSGLTNVELADSDNNSDDDEEADEAEDEETPAGYYTRYEARSDSSGLKRIPGSAMRGYVDSTHPLAFGVGDRLYSLKFDAVGLEPSESLQTVGYYDPDPDAVLASGYASAENRRNIAGKAFAAVQPMGQGKVVFFVDNTQYRLFWVGPSRMIQNAVFLLPGM